MGRFYRMGRSTLRKKGVRRTHKQRGGNTCVNPKPNYTMFFAGWYKPGATEPSAVSLGTRGKVIGIRGEAWFHSAVTNDIIADKEGNLYMTMYYVHCILKVDKNGTITQFTTEYDTYNEGRLGWGLNGSWPLLVAGHSGGPIRSVSSTGVVTNTNYYPKVGAIAALCGDSVGNIYFIDQTQGGIWKIPAGTASASWNAAGGTVWAGSNSQLGKVPEFTTSPEVDLTAARFSSIGTPSTNHMRYDPRTNSIYLYDKGNYQFKRINLATNKVKTLVDLNLNRPRGRVGYLAVHPNADIMYYMPVYCDDQAGSGGEIPEKPTSIFSVDLNTLVVKRYAGPAKLDGVAPNTASTLDSNLLTKLASMENARTAGNPDLNTTTMISTVCDSDAAFIGNTIFNKVISAMCIDSDGYIFVVGQNLPRVWMVSPVPPARPPSSIYTVVTTGTSVTVGWSDDTNAASYTFTISPSPPSVVIPVVVPPATTATFTGLLGVTLYTITVRASNRLGTANPVSIVCGTGIDTTNFALLPPVATSINLLTSGTPSVVSVSLIWTGIRGVPKISYTITPWGGVSGATGATGPPITGMIPQGSPQMFVVTGLQPNTTYRATIKGSLPNPPSYSASIEDVFSATSNMVTFTTPALNPVFLGSLTGPNSFAVNASGPTPMTSALIGNRGIVQDANRNLYVASRTCIYRITPASGTNYFLFDTSQTTPTPTQVYNTPVGFPGSTMSLFAGATTAGPPSTTSQTGAAIRFGNILGMVYSQSENCLYVSDVGYNVIIKVMLSPITATVVGGKIGSTEARTDGAIGTGTLNYPRDLSLGPNNQLFIADYSNNAIRSLNSSGVLSTLSTASSAISLSSPCSVVQMPDNHLLVACAGDHTIRRLAPSTTNPGTYDVSLFAGTPNTSGSADGPVATATFNSPNSMALDAAFNVYVYDATTDSIRVIIGSNVYTYLGNGAGNVDGPAAIAKMNSYINTPQGGSSGMYFDTNRNFYISDTGNGSLRGVTPYAMNLVISEQQLTNYRASAAQASSALIQTTSSARQQTASSAVAQNVSSALAQSISAARESSAVAQVASSAVAQNVSSALAQNVSSALAQSISGAQQSSAVAHNASSALAQSISGARESSAVAQADSSAKQQAASSSLQQRDSSAQQQTASSSVQQRDSSAQQQTALSAAVLIKDDIKRDMAQLQADIAAATQSIYTQNSSTASGSTLATLQTNLQALEQKKNDLMASGRAIFQLSPTYQDSSLQTVIQDSTLSSFGVRKVFDALRNNYVFLNTNNAIVVSPLVPSVRAYTSGATQRGGGKKNSRKSVCLFYYTSK